MASVLIIVTAVLYLGTGIDFICKSNFPMAVVFVSYALANIGLYYAAGNSV